MDQLLLCSQGKIVFEMESKLLSNYDDVLRSRRAWESKLVTGRKGGQQQRVTSTQLHPPSLLEQPG
jgi:hypothetical protein